MIIEPKVRGFICTNAHPKGCAANVEEQVRFIESQGPIANGPKNVLVIGSSTGYGMASRIAAAFGCGAKTLGFFFEKAPSVKRCGTAGYYNSAAFEELAKSKGLYAKSVNGDAFSHRAKQTAIELIQQDLGQVDLVVYSLASPRRQDPDSEEIYKSTLKPIGERYTAKNLNTDTLQIADMTLEPASEQEIADTVKVMGGEDWELWLAALSEAGVLAHNCQTVAYTYLGEKITWPIYGQATIGRAKEDLDRAAAALNQRLSAVGGRAHVAVLKALVTQASSAIPIMPLYISLLYKVMKEAGVHEGCIEQVYRLFTEGLYTDSPRLDEQQRLRMDNLELQPDIQNKVAALWPQVTQENLFEISDYKGHHQDFLKLFGFGLDSVDYREDLSPIVETDFIKL
ncbi:MAG: trans-2-enoyl-CoA reductase family protein [Cellvibrionaceae bacterium]|nr:trans-2-enoyl-CoA reductase family protein [Cellvibrionaceae bacterium]